VPGRNFRIKGSNIKNVQKILANGVEYDDQNIGLSNNGDAYVWLPDHNELPDELKGHVNIKVVTTSGESNEFPYIVGLPFDYLSSTDSLKMEFDFTVKYYNSAGVQKTQKIGLSHGFSKNEINWINNVLTIDLSQINNITGSVQCTFSDIENCEIDKVVVDYVYNNSYNIHYEEYKHHIGSEHVFLAQDNPSLTHDVVFHEIEKRYTTQPSIHGKIHYYDYVAGENREAEFSELDLTVDSYSRRFYMRLFHFH